jgi:protein involved in polysaccharide export with SLBB domain
LFGVDDSALGGCAMSGPKPTAKLEDVITSTQRSPAQKEIREINEKLFASLASAPQPGDYVISAGDLVQVNVFESQELQKEARV